jgi:hypothetical protein
VTSRLEACAASASVAFHVYRAQEKGVSEFLADATADEAIARIA